MIKLEDIEISTRLYDTLKRAGINTVEEMHGIPQRKRWERIRNFGAVSEKQVAKIIAKYPITEVINNE